MSTTTKKTSPTARNHHFPHTKKRPRAILGESRPCNLHFFTIFGLHFYIHYSIPSHIPPFFRVLFTYRLENSGTGHVNALRHKFTYAVRAARGCTDSIGEISTHVNVIVPSCAKPKKRDVTEKMAWWRGKVCAVCLGFVVSESVDIFRFCCRSGFFIVKNQLTGFCKLVLVDCRRVFMVPLAGVVNHEDYTIVVPVGANFVSFYPHVFMSYDLERLKQYPIADVVTKLGYTLKGNSVVMDGEVSSITVDKQKNLFYRFSRGEGGSVVDLVMMLCHVDFKGALDILAEMEGASLVDSGRLPRSKTTVNKMIKEKRGFIPPCNIDKEFFFDCRRRMTKEGAEYWYKRGISEDILEELTVGMLHRFDKDWYTFPVVNVLNGANFFKLRLCPWESGVQKARTNPIGHKATIWPQQYLSDHVKKLFLCEGEADVMAAMSVADEHEYAMCCTHGAGCWDDEFTQLIYKQCPNLESIVLCYDRDEAGMAGEEKVKENLQMYCREGISIGYYPWPWGFKGDLNDLLLSQSGHGN